MLTQTLAANDQKLDADQRHVVAPCEHQLSQLAEYFGIEFSLVCGKTGDLLHAGHGSAAADWSVRGSLCLAVAERRSAEFLEERDYTLTLAIPFYGAMASFEKGERDRFVAVGEFRSQLAPADEGHAGLAEELGLSVEEAARWHASRTPWDPDSLLRIGNLAFEKLEAVTCLQQNVEGLSDNLASTYEEITLLYRITENLRIGEDPAVVWRSTVDWLADIVPAETIAICFEGGDSQNSDSHSGEAATIHRGGPALVDESALFRVTQEFGQESSRQPLVANCQGIEEATWSYGDLKQLVVVPISSGNRCFGYLLAANHVDEAEFGTVEAKLLSSVASILGVHCSNVELFREQAELMAGIIRALSSAIDAKDPYTCGHSDRVARVACRIAEEMGLPEDEVNAIYLSGLLHDVGKIGIADSVLRKPGRLTEAEYEHIKLHPGLGHNILKDIKKIEHVLPGVLHHHEAYNGKGYPDGLVGESIPMHARIIAVADAFDAMGSDRPYRKGMEEGKVDSILKQGAGEQWDASVVDAFFEAREDIRELAMRERDVLRLDFTI